MKKIFDQELINKIVKCVDYKFKNLAIQDKEDICSYVIEKYRENTSIQNQAIDAYRVLFLSRSKNKLKQSDIDITECAETYMKEFVDPFLFFGYLDQKKRMMFMLNVIYGFTNGDIAKITGMSENRVIQVNEVTKEYLKRRHTRMRHTIKEELKEKGFFGPKLERLYKRKLQRIYREKYRKTLADKRYKNKNL